MGDSVGVRGDHLSHTVGLVKKVLRDGGFYPDRIDAEAVRTFAASMTTLERRPLEEEEFLMLVEMHPQAMPGWNHLKELAKSSPPTSEEMNAECEVPG